MTLVVLRCLLRRVPPAVRNRHPNSHNRSRALSMKRGGRNTEPIPPGHTIDAVKPPPLFSTAPSMPTLDPMAHVRQPVTSAHMIVDHVVSARDSVAIAPSGSIVHGRYGDLGVQDGIPLEYLALLRPAAEAAAATAHLGHKGTLLVFGATQPAGLAAVQLWKGPAVCAVVGGEHSGEDDMMAIVKGLTKEPGFAVAEEYALLKKNFADMVSATVNAETMEPADPETYLADFKKNLLDYSVAYPDTRPAAVSASHLEFKNKKDKDREHFRDNMDPYLAQFPAGSPPMDPAKVDAYFNAEQYAIFKTKFSTQTTAVITGDDVGDFSPAQIVSSMIQRPEQGSPSPDGPIPFEFSLSANTLDIPCTPAGPVAGAIIAVTPDLEVAAKALHAANTKREKAEALQFLTFAQRNAFAAASSVVAQAKGAPVLVVGGTCPLCVCLFARAFAYVRDNCEAQKFCRYTCCCCWKLTHAIVS